MRAPRGVTGRTQCHPVTDPPRRPLPQGGHDPAKVLSEALAELYSHSPNAASTSLFGHTAHKLAEDCDGAAAAATAAFKLLVVHPSGHFPPRQSEFAQALRSFALRWRD